MNATPTPPPAPGTEGPVADGAVRVGVLVPLSPPGWVEAGRSVLAGAEVAVRDVNEAGGIGGRPLELVVRDTASDPERATAAVAELAGLGVAGVVGEYHSVVARAVAAEADAGGAFLCSSAVLDSLTEEPTEWVARLAPAQSYGWRIYADALLDAGHRRVAVAVKPSVYWASGTRVLRDHLAPRGGTVVELDARALGPAALCDALVEHGATALLLLVGFPEPAVSIVKAVRRDPRLAEVTVGAPGRAAGVRGVGGAVGGRRGRGAVPAIPARAGRGGAAYATGRGAVLRGVRGVRRRSRPRRRAAYARRGPGAGRRSVVAGRDAGDGAVLAAGRERRVAVGLAAGAGRGAGPGAARPVPGGAYRLSGARAGRSPGRPLSPDGPRPRRPPRGASATRPPGRGPAGG